MRESKVLYQIKSLEKLILRNFKCDKQLCLNQLSEPTPTQMQIIEYILKNKNEYVYQKDLEEILNLRRATVSGVLQTMEKNGLLKRVTNDNDARAKRIILNEHTKEIFLTKEKEIKKIEKILTKDISNSDLEIFYKVVDKMKENLKNNNI